MLFCILAILVFFLATPNSAFAVPSGTVISNTAKATYGRGSVGGIVSPSNTVLIVTVGSAPNAVDDSATTEIGTPVSINVLLNDTDPDGDHLIITAVDSPTAQGGLANINDNGTPYYPDDDFIDYSPPTGFSGSDNFTYTISDGNGGTDTAVVTVAISALLWITKSTSRDSVSIGESLAYTLKVENVTGALIRSLVVIDKLPLGFRYNSGSTLIDGTRAPDPAVSPDGRTLTFNIGDLGPNETVNINYTVEVTAGAKLGVATNRAFAMGANDVNSNIVSASVTVKEDLFRGSSFIVGRVISDNCEDLKTDAADGVEGVRIYLEDGTFSITDEQGMFHFEGVRPGTHVVQLDLDTLPAIYELSPCEANNRFAGRTYSVPEANIVQLDLDALPEIYDTSPCEQNTRFAGSAHSRFVDLQGGTLWRTNFYVSLRPRIKGNVSLELNSTLRDDTIAYRVGISATNVPLFNLRLTIVLPEDVSYVNGSSLLDRLNLPDPVITGNVLTYRLGSMGNKWHRELTFKGIVKRTDRTRSLVTKGNLLFNTPAAKDQRTPLAENELLLPGVGAEEDGNSESLIQKTQSRVVVETAGLRHGEKLKVQALENGTNDAMPRYDQTWLERAKPGLEWLWPGPDYGPPIPSIKLAIKHHPKDTLTVLREGREVSRLNYETTIKNKAGTVAVSLWRGVDLNEGDNYFKVIAHNGNGKETGQLRRKVHYSSAPVHAELIEEESRLVADGKTPPVAAVRLTDKDGYPAREGIIGELSIEPPYASLEEVETRNSSPLTGLGPRKPHYKVGKNGIALIEFEPTSKSGEALIRFHFEDEDRELRVWLQPEYRDWILVGLAEGTVGYNSVSGHMENLDDAGVDDNLYEDGRLAFFAKGKVKEKWLLTIAYDSEKEGPKTRDSLFQTIDPDRYYTLYGDATQQSYDAASGEKLYLKIERDRFYALFGDYDTGLTVTELSRYSRSLTGLKSELQSEKYSLNVFLSETDQAFVKDEIRGDGTSGLYYLSRKDIVMNSEKVTIEVRDRFRSEVILSSSTLKRHIDYNIDYDAGTLFFREPIFSKDQNFNPIFIVVDYETTDTSGEAYSYGGRGAIRLFDQKFEIGSTYIHEGQKEADGDLVGVDATLDIGHGFEFKTEFATSDRESVGGDLSDNAYLAELTHRSKKVDGALYIREQGEDFGLGQQNSSEIGTRKIGGWTRYHHNRRLSVDGEIYRQFNLATDAERDLAEVEGNYSADAYSLRLGLRHAEDRLDDGTESSSNQVMAGASRHFYNKRLLVRMDHEQSVGNNENPDFPTRTMLGADYKLTDTVTLFGAQEFTWGENEDTQGTRIGLKATPWTGGQVGTSVERQYNENGDRVFANLGLLQTWRLNEKWSIDGGLDHSRTVKDPGNTSFNPNVPPASGGDTDFTSVSLGTAYREETWSCNWRGEFRIADNEDKWGFTSGVYGEPKKGIGLSAATQFIRTDSDEDADSTKGNLRFGLAYRPKNTRWIVLDRLDFILEEQEGGVSELDSRRIVNNLNANFKPDSRTQIALQYGAKYVRERLDGGSSSGYTDLIGIEARYDITPKYDIGVRGSILHSWNSHLVDYSTGISFGYNIFENAWVSTGYNFTGFEDRDFSPGSFTAQGPFVQFRMKFDQGSLRDALLRFQGIKG